MNRYAVVSDGVVTNVVLWDGTSEWETSSDAVLLPPDSPVSEGYSYTAGEFTAPLNPPPRPDGFI
ncbi:MULTISPECIES: hypothetical protein [unclassified Caballeronia]|uniref:hypothetical protein n=1 Tax=unclassified Caballeronia TaxID=2646786 RepID=UPI00285A4A59|nr:MULTISPECIES: hypothetical protein [unclassified Caballeronia]MDR5812023.1 hypothetical protein [Caballeronia sp. LZ033]MDR5879011.1 hypothetical protein [Caballeronia sp. LZ032]